MRMDVSDARDRLETEDARADDDNCDASDDARGKGLTDDRREERRLSLPLPSVRKSSMCVPIDPALPSPDSEPLTPASPSMNR